MVQIFKTSRFGEFLDVGEFVIISTIATDVHQSEETLKVTELGTVL